MSEISVNRLVNKAGNGPVETPYGLTVAGEQTIHVTVNTYEQAVAFALSAPTGALVTVRADSTATPPGIQVTYGVLDSALNSPRPLNASQIQTEDGMTLQEKIHALVGGTATDEAIQFRLGEHELDPEAHPGLADFITEEADRATSAAVSATLSKETVIENAQQVALDKTAVLDAKQAALDAAQAATDQVTLASQAKTAAEAAAVTAGEQVALIGTAVTDAQGFAQSASDSLDAVNLVVDVVAGHALSASESAATAQEAIDLTAADVVTTGQHVSSVQAALADVLVSQTEVANAQMGAIDAKNQAVAAAELAGSYVGMFPDTTAGLAGVTDGKYFSTPGTSSAEYSRLYRRTNSTTAEFISDYPSSVSIGPILDAIVFSNPDGYVLTIMDGNKRAAFGIQDDGTVEMARALVRNLIVTEALTQLQLKGYDLFIGDDALLSARYVKPGYLFDIQDVSGNTCVAIKEDGTLAVAALELLGGAVGGAESTANFDAEINHVLGNGQSLAEGHSSTPIITTVQPQDSIRFIGGVRAKDAGEADAPARAAARASFVPLTEQINGVLGESPYSGMAESIKAEILAEYGLTHNQQTYQLLMSCPAEGGQTLASLNTNYYQRVYDDIFYAHQNCKTLGKTYRMQAMTWAQGEADDANKTDPVSYKVALKNYIARVNADVLAISGKKTPLKFIASQPVSHEHQGFGMDGTPRSAIALAELAEEDANAYLACPNYMFPRAADNGHLTNVGSKWFGAYFGLVYQAVVVNKQNWEPLKPSRIYFDDKIAMVEFYVPKPPLVFDTTIVTAHPTKGFRVVDAMDVEIPISSVSIVNQKYVKIVCNTTIPAGSKVQYAYKSESTDPNRNGPVNGPRGNLRDSQGNDKTITISGVTKRLDNWCILFSKKAT